MFLVFGYIIVTIIVDDRLYQGVNLVRFNMKIPFFSSKKAVEKTAKKLSLMDRWKGVAYENLKNKDIAQLLKSEKLAAGLDTAPLHSTHPLRSIALKLKTDIYRIDLSSLKVGPERN
jgi:hypothetical protein